jgi:diguanylate cyclase (GGDEF)-like protein
MERVVEGVRALERELDGAVCLDDAIERVMEHLVAAGMPLPSLYLARGGRMRCLAYRGYWQVLDGIPVDAGVLGEVMRTGRTVVVGDTSAVPDFLEAIGGTVAEVCVPLRHRGAVIGILNVESRAPLPARDVAEVEGCATALTTRIDALGGLDPESPWQALSRHVARLSALADAAVIERAAVRGACELAAMSSAVLVVPTDDGVRFAAATGPCGAALTRLPPPNLEVLLHWAHAGISCWTHGEAAGAGFTWNEPLRAAGVASLIALPLPAGPERSGVLLLADERAVRQEPEGLERLEILAKQTATSLRMAAAMAELRLRASQDPLTGLGHHAAFHAVLADRRARGTGTTAVLLVDLDAFKSVNDTHGHPAGDRLLVTIAATLLGHLREHDELFHIGGDEFAVVAEVASPEAAEGLAERLLAAAREHGGITLSIGIALPTGDETPAEVIARADRALYEAKRAGRDRCRLV